VQFEGAWRPWRHVGTAIDGLDELLAPVGLGPGALVGVVIRNRPEMVRAILAVLGTGRVLVTLSSAVPLATLTAEIRRLALPVVVARPSDWGDELRAAVHDAGSLGIAFTDGDDAPEIVVGAGTRPEDAPTTRAGVAVQMLTSGTTGTPKRIDLLYESLEHEIVSTMQYSSAGVQREPRLATGTAIIWNPLLHIGGLRGLITNAVAGRRIALLERFSVPAWAAIVREHRPKAVSLVPAALRMVLDSDLPNDALDGVQAVFSGTAPLEPGVAEQFEERFGVPVLVVYGATEFAGGVAGWTIRDRQAFGTTKRGSVGRPNPGMAVRIVDQESGEPVANGAVGLLEVRGPQLAQEGWLRTTDLARIDDDDFIWIEGRADDVIIRGGFKVATGQVTDLIRTHPAVLDACVIGRPDERLGQVPVAAVELRAGSTLTPEDLLAWAKPQLSAYQVPVAVRIVERLPRTASMKVSQPGVQRLFDAPTPA
jgi:acyl-CoA synthetase (AMP-forming)/AMP-acid ligase II